MKKATGSRVIKIEAFIVVGIALLNLALLFSFSTAAEIGNPEIEDGASIEQTKPKRIAIPKATRPHVCKPDLTCISKESLPQWRNLTDTFLTQIKTGVHFEEANQNAPPAISKRVAELLEAYLEIYKRDQGISCALRRDCLKILETMATNIKMDAEFIDTCYSTGDRSCVSTVRQSRLNLNRWLRKARTAVEAIIKTTRKYNQLYKLIVN